MTEQEKNIYEAWLKDFGRCVAMRRKTLGLTQKQAAERVGMHKKFYRDIEYGLRPITTRTLFQLCMRLDLTLPYSEAMIFVCD